MHKFENLVIMESSNVSEKMMEILKKAAKNITVYDSIPESDEEIIERIHCADGILMSYTSSLNRSILQQCPLLKYIGLCCSLYSPESANVDITAAEELGIKVTGVREYGDNGVVEFVLYEIIGLFHGYGKHMFESYAKEVTGTSMGIIGLGDTGCKIAYALKNLGADVYYYSRTRKAEHEQAGIKYLPLKELLEECEVVCTCLNKNVVLLGENEFSALGDHKLLINTGLSPSFKIDAVKNWLKHPNTYLSCDSDMALGDLSILENDKVYFKNKASGGTIQALERLREKVLQNLFDYLEKM